MDYANVLSVFFIYFASTLPLLYLYFASVLLLYYLYHKNKCFLFCNKGEFYVPSTVNVSFWYYKLTFQVPKIHVSSTINTWLQGLLIHVPNVVINFANTDR